MRKEADFEVLDKIILYYGKNDVVAGVLNKNKAVIADEVLAAEIKEGTGEGGKGYVKEWNINGENVIFEVVRI